MASVHTTVQARPPERTTRGLDEEIRGAGDENVLRYFRDIASFPLMDAATEQRIARRIVELEHEEWVTCLEHPPVAVVAGAELLASHVHMRASIAALTRANEAWKRGRGRFAPEDRARHAAMIGGLARKARCADQDREILDRLQQWILDGDRGRGLPGVRPGKNFEKVRAAVKAQRREGRLLRERFVTSNLRLVISVARRQGKSQLSLADLIQEGNIGLMKAVQRFDPDKGYRFSTYAIWWIRHSITRALADRGRIVRLPVHLTEGIKRMQRVRARFHLHAGREPSDRELACELGISMLKLRRLQRESTDPALSLDREVAQDATARFVDNLPDDSSPSPPEQVELGRWQDLLGMVVDRLPGIEAQIVRWRYGLDTDDELTLKELGERHGLSRERIRQLQQQALNHIRISLR